MNYIYLIYGSNYTLVNKEIKKITDNFKDVVNFDLSIDNVSLLLNDASCMSIFNEKKVVVGENANFLTSQNTNVVHDIEYLTRYLNSNEYENTIILSVIAEKLDERKKIVKLLKEKAKVIFKTVADEKKLESFVIEDFKNNDKIIDFKTANYFVNYVGKNIDIIISEINKMVIYKDDLKQITKEDIDNISSKAFKDNIFDFIDGIMNKDYKKMFECYYDLKRLNEEPIKIISLLANQFTLIYQVKLLSKQNIMQNEIADVLKVHPYRVKLAIDNYYSLSSLENVLKKLHQLDYDIKSGKIDKNMGLEKFLLDI